MKSLFVIFLILITSYAYANFPVVKNKQGEIVYRQEPAFEKGKGIANTVISKGGQPEDYEEVVITQAEWDNHIKVIKDKDDKKKKDKDNAIKKLKSLGLTEDEARAISD